MASVYINDVANAFIAGLTAPKIINGRAFNVGIRDGNFTVRGWHYLLKICSQIVRLFSQENTDVMLARIGLASRVFSES